MRPNLSVIAALSFPLMALSVGALADEPPGVTIPAAAKPIVRADYEPKWLAFHRRHLVEAYRQHGKRNPHWDAPAEAFLEEFAAVLADVPWQAPAAQTCELGNAAVKLGCDDPLVRFALNVAEHGRRRVVSNRGLATANQLISQGYPPQWAAYEATMAAFYYSRFYENDAEKCEEAAGVADEQLARFLNRRWIQPGEERVAFAWLSPVLGFNDTYVPDAGALAEKFLQAEGIDPWLRHMFAARLYTREGWGSGTGSATFVDALEKAETHLRAAYQLRPQWPEPATEMIGIAHARKDDEETPWVWFERAVAAQLDYEPAYWRMLLFSRPSNGGSFEQMEKVGRYGLDTGRFDTDAPRHYLVAMDWMDNHWEKRGEFWRTEVPKYYPQLQRMFAGYETSDRMRWNRDYLRSMHAVVAYRCGDTKTALEQVIKVKNVLHPRIASVIGDARPAEFVQEIHATGGEAGHLVRDAQQLEARQEWGAAEEKLAAAADEYRDNPPALAHVKHRRASIDVCRKFESGQWFDLTFDEALSGWRIYGGQWRRHDDATIVARATGRNILLLLEAPVGHRFQYRGEVQILRPNYMSTNGGPVFCHADQPVLRWRSFLLYPAKNEIAIRRSFQFGDPMPAHVLPRWNSFEVTVWDKSILVRLNGDVIHRGPWLDDHQVFGHEERIGLGGHYWFDGSDVSFRNLQLLRLEKPPDDL